MASRGGFRPRKKNGSVSWCQGWIDVLDSLHPLDCRVSVLHDFCGAWFRVTKGRTWFVRLSVCKLFLHVLACSVCKATLSSGWPAETETRHLSLRGSAERAAPMENEPLVTPTVVMFTLSDFTGSSRGLLFGLLQTTFYCICSSAVSHSLRGLFDLIVLLTVCAHTETHTEYSRSFFLSFSPYCVRGWVVSKAGHLIQFSLSFMKQLPVLSEQNLFIERSTSGSIILNVLSPLVINGTPALWLPLRLEVANALIFSPPTHLPAHLQDAVFWSKDVIIYREKVLCV